ncbi:MAG: sugar ABC transporter substrate-binding protein [Spirochaetaceae bacterium]|nr:sugar ABC transporter substrate-binding protein [Spirochaetaceae bacterium]
MMVVLAVGAAWAAPAKSVTITWGYWGSPSEVEENKSVAAEFERQNPGIKVEHMTAPWGEYFTRLQTQFDAKAAPDVMFLTYISTSAPMGVLQDLGPLFKKYGFDRAKYPEGLLNLFSIGGKLYGVPRDNDTKVVFVNKKLFREAGIPVPTASWTTEQFADAAKKLTNKEASQYGLMFDPGNWFLWVFMDEGKMFDDEANPKKVAFDANAVAGLQFAGDLINKYKVTPDYDQLSNGTIRQQMFLNGKVAMLIDNHSQVPSFLAQKDLEWDIAPIPTFPGKKHHNVAGGAGYTIYSGTKQPEAAWKFWEFLNTQGIKLYMKSGTMVPPRTDLLNSKEFSGDKPYNAKVFVDETVSGRGFPVNQWWWNVYSAAGPFFDLIWVAGDSAASAVEAATPEMQKEIKAKK